VLYAHEMILNELAQGFRPVAEGVEWFEGLSADNQRKVRPSTSSPSSVQPQPSATVATHFMGDSD
jgi:hypothetical protein